MLPPRANLSLPDSLDKPDVYSEILAKVLRGANVIGEASTSPSASSELRTNISTPTDLHLDLLATNSGPYSTLSPSDRARIEQRLKRASDFFGQVICRFVMRDVGMLVDKCKSLFPAEFTKPKWRER